MWEAKERDWNRNSLIFRDCLSLPHTSSSPSSHHIPVDHSLVQIYPGLCLWASAPADPTLAMTWPHIPTRETPFICLP